MAVKRRTNELLLVSVAHWLDGNGTPTVPRCKVQWCCVDSPVVIAPPLCSTTSYHGRRAAAGAPIAGPPHAATLLLQFAIACFLTLLLLSETSHAACTTVLNVAEGTATIASCALAGSHTIDVGEIMSDLYDQGSRPQRFVLRVEDITVPDPVGHAVLGFANASAFTFSNISVDITMRSLIGGEASLGVNVVLPTGSTIQLGTLQYSSTAVIAGACGHSGVCVASDSIMPLSLFAIDAATIAVVGGATVTISGIVFIGDLALNHTEVRLAGLNLSMSTDAPNADVVGIRLPSTASLTDGAVLKLHGNASSSLTLRVTATSANISRAVVALFDTLTVTSSRVVLQSLQLHLGGSGQATNCTILSQLHVVRLVSLTLSAPGATMDVVDLGLRDPIDAPMPAGVLTAGRDAGFVVVSVGLTLASGASLTVRGCHMDVSSLHRASLLSLVRLQGIRAASNTTLDIVSNVAAVQLASDVERNASFFVLALAPSATLDGTVWTVTNNTATTWWGNLTVAPSTSGVAVLVLFPTGWRFATQSRLTVSSNTLKTNASGATFNTHYFLFAGNDAVLMTGAEAVLDGNTMDLNPLDATNGVIGKHAVFFFARGHVGIYNGSLVSIVATSLQLQTSTASSVMAVVYVTGVATVGHNATLHLSQCHAMFAGGKKQVGTAGVLVVLDQLELSGPNASVFVVDVNATVASKGYVVGAEVGIYVNALRFAPDGATSSTAGQTVFVGNTTVDIACEVAASSFGVFHVGSLAGNGTYASIDVEESVLSIVATTSVATTSVAAVKFSNLQGPAGTVVLPAIRLQAVSATSHLTPVAYDSRLSAIGMQFHVGSADVVFAGRVRILDCSCSVRNKVSVSLGIAWTATEADAVATMPQWLLANTSLDVWSGTAVVAVLGLLVNHAMVLQPTGANNNILTPLHIDGVQMLVNSTFGSSVGVASSTLGLAFKETLEVHGSMVLERSNITAIGCAYTGGVIFENAITVTGTTSSFHFERNRITLDRHSGTVGGGGNPYGEGFRIFSALVVSAGVQTVFSDNHIENYNRQQVTDPLMKGRYTGFYVEEVKLQGVHAWNASWPAIVFRRNVVQITSTAARRIDWCDPLFVGPSALGSQSTYAVTIEDNDFTVTCYDTLQSQASNGMYVLAYLDRANVSALTIANNTITMNSLGSTRASMVGVYVEFVPESVVDPTTYVVVKHIVVANNTISIQTSVSMTGIELLLLGESDEDLPVQVVGNDLLLNCSRTTSTATAATVNGVVLDFIPLQQFAGSSANHTSLLAITDNRLTMVSGPFLSLLTSLMLNFLAPAATASDVRGVGCTLDVSGNAWSIAASTGTMTGVTLYIEDLSEFLTIAAAWSIKRNNMTLQAPAGDTVYSNVLWVDSLYAVNMQGNGLALSENRWDGWQGKGLETYAMNFGSGVLVSFVSALCLRQGASFLVTANHVTRAHNATFVGLNGLVVESASTALINDNTFDASGAFGAMVSLEDVTATGSSVFQINANVARNTTNWTSVLEVQGIATATKLASISISFNDMRSATFTGPVFHLQSTLTIRDRSGFVVGNNTMWLHGAEPLALLRIDQNTVLLDECVLMVRHNVGLFVPVATASLNQPLVSMLGLRINTTSQATGAVFGMQGNQWNTSSASTHLINSGSILVYESQDSNGVRFGCNAIGSPLVTVTDYGAGSYVPASFVAPITNPVVACGTCDVRLDCFAPNTASVAKADGMCTCQCKQASVARAVSVGNALPCSPPTSGGFTLSWTASIPNTTASASLSASTTPTWTASVPNTTDSASLSASPTPTWSASSTGGTRNVSGSRSWNVSGTASLNPSPSETHHPTSSWDRSRTAIRTRSANISSVSSTQTPSGTNSVTPSVSKEDPSLSRSLMQSLSDRSHSATLSDVPTATVSAVETRSVNPCAMPWATNASEIIGNFSASTGLVVSVPSTGFQLPCSIGYDVLSTSTAVLNLTLSPLHEWRIPAVPLPDPKALVFWTVAGNPSYVDMHSTGRRTATIRISPVSYNKFISRRFTITILATSFYCSPKASDVVLEVAITPVPVLISAVAVKAMSSVASSLSVATANPTAGVAASRVSMLQNLLECTVDLIEDNGNSFTGLHFGPASGQYSRGAVAGNVLFFVAIGAAGLVVAAVAATYGRLRRHKPWMEGFVLITDVLHYPSVLMIPLAVILQPTLTESVSLIVVEPIEGDWVIGAAGILSMAAIVLPFTYVLLFDFRCVIAKRTDVDRAKQRSKIEQSVGWALGPLGDGDAAAQEDGAVAVDKKAQQRPPVVHRVVRAVFEEDVHWVVADPSKTDQRWKRRFLFLFADYRIRWFCLVDMWISVVLGGVAGINLGIRKICLTQLSCILAGYCFLFLSCVLLRPAFGRFASAYVVAVNGLGVLGSAATLVGSWSEDDTAVSISTLSALLISGVSMIKTLPDLLLLVVALPSIVAAVARPFSESAQLHSFMSQQEQEMQTRHADLLKKASNNGQQGFALLKEDDDRSGVGTSWSPHALTYRGDGGEDEDARRRLKYGLLMRDGAALPPGDDRDDTRESSGFTQKPSSSSYVFNRRILMDLIDSDAFHMRLLVSDVVAGALPLTAKDMRVLVRVMAEDAMAGGMARLVATYAVNKLLLPRVDATVAVRELVHDLVKQAILHSERSKLGVHGIDDLLGSLSTEDTHETYAQTAFMTSAADEGGGVGASFLSGLNRSSMGAMGERALSRKRSMRAAAADTKRPVATPQGSRQSMLKPSALSTATTPRRRRASSFSSSSSDSDSSSASSSSSSDISSVDL